MFSKMIGTGSYGYVYRPCLFFLDVSSENMQIMQETIKNRNNHVSKLLKKEFAEKELLRYELIRIADPYNNFHLGNMFMANPSRRNIPLLSIGDNGKEIIDNFEEYKLIIMKYGGKTLREYGNIIYNNKKTHVDASTTFHASSPNASVLRTFASGSNHKYEQNIVIFWKDSIRLIQGVNCFIQNNIVHHDIKSANIVFDYDEDVDINKCKNRSNYIDFGLSQSMESIYEKSKMSQYNYSIFYYNFPPELFLYDKERFETFRDLNMKERKRWFQYICTSWIKPQNKHNQCDQTSQGAKHPPKLVVEGYASQKPSDQTLETAMPLRSETEIVRQASYSEQMVDTVCDILTTTETGQGSSFPNSLLTPPAKDIDSLLLNNSVDSDDDDFGHSFMDSTIQAIKELKNTKILEKYLGSQNNEEKFIENFQQFLLHDIDKYPDFKSFMKDSLYTLDIYGLGQTLLYMLIHTYQYLPKNFVEKMYILLHKMAHNNVTERIRIKKLIQEYIILLQLLDPDTDVKSPRQAELARTTDSLYRLWR